MLTALHVIGPLAEPFAQFPGTIRLEFGDGALGARWTWNATATLIDRSLADDWAVLKLDTPPPYPARPLPLAGLRFDPNPVAWETWGFPTIAANEGTGYDGATAVQGEVFEISCPALAQSMVDGISGAPLIISGEVGAIVQQAFMTRDAQGRLRAEDSKLRARTLTSLTTAVGARLPPWDDYAKLPFESEVREAVRHLFTDPDRLADLGGRLGVDVSVVRREFLPGKITRRILKSKLRPTYDALKDASRPLSTKHAVRIVRCAAAGGLGEPPAADLRSGLRREASEIGVSLCVRQPVTGEMFVWRARYEADLGSFDQGVFDPPLAAATRPRIGRRELVSGQPVEIYVRTGPATS